MRRRRSRLISQAWKSFVDPFHIVPGFDCSSISPPNSSSVHNTGSALSSQTFFIFQAQLNVIFSLSISCNYSNNFQFSRRYFNKILQRCLKFFFSFPINYFSIIKLGDVTSLVHFPSNVDGRDIMFLRICVLLHQKLIKYLRLTEQVSCNSISFKSHKIENSIFRQKDIIKKETSNYLRKNISRFYSLCDLL